MWAVNVASEAAEHNCKADADEIGRGYLIFDADTDVLS